jgi:hypothetical protein
MHILAKFKCDTVEFGQYTESSVFVHKMCMYGISKGRR